MSVFILGISCYYHDASAALLEDGKVVAATEEERFTRKKHDTSFPINAISYCLKSKNITIKDIAFIGFYEKPFLKFERVLYQHLESFPLSIKTFLNSIPSWINEKLRIISAIRKKLKYSKDVIFIEHHLSCAASSFFASPFQEAAILTVDDAGEWSTTTYGIGRDNDISLMKEIRFPHSLELFYSAITAYLGFRVNNSEYKIVGLAAYGDMNKETNPYYEKLRKVIDRKEDGSYRLDMSYFVYHYRDKMPSKKLCRMLKAPVRKSEPEVTQAHKDIASAMQLIYEEGLFKMLNHLYDKTGCKNLALAGGYALNSVTNEKILKNTSFENIWNQSTASNKGLSIGAASYLYHAILKYKRI